MILEIIDDGIGIESDKLKDNTSYGLIGMKERIYAIDGEIQFVSSKNEGTKIKIKIPKKINNKNESINS